MVWGLCGLLGDEVKGVRVAQSSRSEAQFTPTVWLACLSGVDWGLV